MGLEKLENVCTIMRDRNWYDKHRWRLKHGYSITDDYLLEELKYTEWSPEFEKLMRNRLILGALRYGRMGHRSIPKDKPKYDRCGSIRKRIKFFENTGNAEWLVDIANLALLMFEEHQHPNFHFNSVDDGYHDKIINK